MGFPNVNRGDQPQTPTWASFDNNTSTNALDFDHGFDTSWHNPTSNGFDQVSGSLYPTTIDNTYSVVVDEIVFNEHASRSEYVFDTHTVNEALVTGTNGTNPATVTLPSGPSSYQFVPPSRGKFRHIACAPSAGAPVDYKKLEQKRIACPANGCPRTFVRPGCLRLHMTKKHGKSFHECVFDDCEGTFYGRDKFRDHLRRDHYIDLPEKQT